MYTPTITATLMLIVYVLKPELASKECNVKSTDHPESMPEIRSVISLQKKAEAASNEIMNFLFMSACNKTTPGIYIVLRS